MRSLPFTIDSAKGYAALITIQYGINTIRFTTYQSSVTIGGTTWQSAPGAKISNILTPSDGSPATTDINIMAVTGGIIEPGDATRGKFDGWPITIEVFDTGNPSLGKFDWMPAATIGNVIEDTNGVVTITANGPLNRAQGPATEHYSLTCRADLGDNRCKVPILGSATIDEFDIGRGQTFVLPSVSTGLLKVSDAYGRVRTGTDDTVEDYANVYFECTVAGTTDATTAPTYDATVGNTTVDGTATFIARNSFLRAARGKWTGDFTIQLSASIDSRADDDDSWFVMGGIYVRSGPLNGYTVIPIRAWNPSTLTLTTFLPLAEDDIPDDTQMEIYAGCDLTRDMCFSRFDNIVNGRFETFVPPSNAIGAVV